MSSAPNLEGILLLEQPFCKVTHDELKRQLRFQQRLIEREFNGCNSILKSLQDKHKGKSSREADNQDGSSQTRRKLNHQIGNQEENGNPDSSLNVQVDDSIDAEMSVSIDQSFDGSNHPLGLNSSSSSGNGGNQSNAQLEKSLDGMIGKLRGLKRKLSPLPNALTSTLSSSKARYSHLQDLHEIKSTNSKEFENWSKIRLDRFISDWMLRRGFKESAKSIGREGWSNHPQGGIENLIDWDLFNELNGIEDSLVPPNGNGNGNGNGKNSCTLALNWCSENKSSLKKIKDSTIEFDLRLQEFIELNRIRTPESLKEAILYARKHLLPLLSQSPSSTISKPELSKEEILPNIPTSLSRSSGDTSIGIRAINRDLSRNQVTSSTSIPKNDTSNTTSSLTKEQEAEQFQQERMKSQILRAMGLLASGPNNWSYQDLYNQDRWLLLKENFRKVFLDLHSLPMSSTLHISLSAGLSSLKVPACYVPDPISGSDEKPVDGKKKKEKLDGEGSEKGSHQPPNHLGRLGGGGSGSGDSNETWYAVRRSDGTVQISTNRNELLGDVNDDDPTTGESNIVQVINSERSNVDEMNESNITSGSGASTRINYDETGNISHGNPNSLPSSLTFNDNSSVLNVNQCLQIGTTSSTPILTHSHGHGSNSEDFIKKKLNSSKSVDCPICDSKGLGLLAKEVPWSHHENSTLVCWISGKLINEENPPMCLPNGRAYSRSALEDMALKSKDGMTVVCPRTGDQYKFSELRKVYIS